MTQALALSLNNFTVKKELKQSVHELYMAKDNLAETFTKHLGEECVSEVIYKFLDTREDEKTKTMYEIAIRQFFESIGIRSIDDVKMSDLHNINCSVADDYTKALEEKYASNTVKQKKNAMQTLFNYIRREFKRNFEINVFDINPFAEIKVKDTDSRTYGDYSEEELKKIFNYTYSKSDKLAYTIAITTGLRVAEILDLNINTSFERLNNGIMCVIGRGKHDKEFLHRITEQMYVDCVDMASDNDNKGYVFKGMRGMTNSNMLKRLYSTLRYIGISEEQRVQRNLCLHSFRKCTASLVYDITSGDKAAIQDVLGHSDIATTEKHYIVIDKKARTTNNMGENIYNRLFGENDYRSELAEVMNELEGFEVREKLLKGLNESEIRKIIQVLKG